MNFWPFTSKQPSSSKYSLDEKLSLASISQWQEGKPLYKQNDFQAQINAYNKWVYRCAQVIADACCVVPFNLYTVKNSNNQVRNFRHKTISKKQTEWLEAYSPSVNQALRKQNGELVKIQEHTLHDLMRNVNPFMNALDLKKLKWICDRIVGNAYWYKVKDGQGNVVEIWPLAPQNMAVIPSSKNFIEGYEYRNGNKKIRFEENEIIHFKDPDISDPFYGKSPLSAAVNPVTLQAYMDKFNTDLFANMAIPAAILSTESTNLTDDVVNKIKARWRDFTGFMKGRTGDVVVLGHGLKVDKLTMSPQELSYNESMIMRRNEIFGIFGVPLTKADPSQIAANNEASDIQFLRDTIHPLLIRDEQKLNEKLLPEFDERLIGAYDDPVPSNKEFTTKQNVEYVKAGIKTRNEVRQTEGLEPLPPEDGDIVPPFQGSQQTTPQDVPLDQAKAIAAHVRKAVYGV